MSLPANNQESALPFSYLEAYLAPLLPWLGRPDVTDIFINRPGEIWVEALGGSPKCLSVPELTEALLWRLARQVASLTHQGISREHPLLAGTLPDGSRVQIVAPPATRGPMAIAIRKHVVADFALANYSHDGAFLETEISSVLERRRSSAPMSTDRRDIGETLSAAVRARKNIVIAGGTSTGKTTFLNAMIKEIPQSERLILIEDTPEVQLHHPNSLGLVAVKGSLGEAQVTADDLLQAALRLRPDRIILGELRGSEAYTFLRAVNTGHPGSLTTIHADNPEGAIEQLALIILQSGVQLSRADIIDYIRSVIDMFVQVERRNGKRVVSQIVTGW
jgi:type IV secretion system protein VirB11